jgi:alpha-tubulin suppressor-like RCC1 family protein
MLGDNDNGQASPPPGTFKSVSAGRSHTCGVRSDGLVDCSGHPRYGETSPPPRSFESVSAGGGHTCGVRSEGLVDCWGNNDDGKASPPR